MGRNTQHVSMQTTRQQKSCVSAAESEQSAGDDEIV
jgi:hypothetical protein